MDIKEWYVGFYAPYLRNAEGRLTLQGIFGHCDVWGATEDGTWLFLDPLGRGTTVQVIHRYEDVHDAISARYALCRLILRLPAKDPAFRFPLHGLLTCAAFVGHIVGVRALVPTGLRRKLLALGAEIIHEATQGRPEGQGCASA